ncbi:hypothetical protein CLAIMM_08281, partial [Cladophialophora immunda]
MDFYGCSTHALPKPRRGFAKQQRRPISNGTEGQQQDDAGACTRILLAGQITVAARVLKALIGRFSCRNQRASTTSGPLSAGNQDRILRLASISRGRRCRLWTHESRPRCTLDQ